MLDALCVQLSVSNCKSSTEINSRYGSSVSIIVFICSKYVNNSFKILYECNK